MSVGVFELCNNFYYYLEYLNTSFEKVLSERNLTIKKIYFLHSFLLKYKREIKIIQVEKESGITSALSLISAHDLYFNKENFNNLFFGFNKRIILDYIDCYIKYNQLLVPKPFIPCSSLKDQISNNFTKSKIYTQNTNNLSFMRGKKFSTIYLDSYDKKDLIKTVSDAQGPLQSLKEDKTHKGICIVLEKEDYDHYNKLLEKNFGKENIKTTEF